MSSSYPIVFYVSGHGLGHLSRSIEVLTAVRRAEPGAAVVVKTSAPARLFDGALDGAVEVATLECDAGMLQVDSLNVDSAASIRRAKAFQRRLPALVATEAAFLRGRGARAVVGDIPPLAFAAAAAAGVRAIAIGNFTWDWIYEGYPEESPAALAAEIRETYRTAACALRLPMAGGFAGLEAITRDIPFIARRSGREPDDIRRLLGLGPRAGGKALVLASFGGYGVDGLDAAGLGALRDYIVVTTDLPARAHRIAPAPGVLHVAERALHAIGLRYVDLVRAADVVVTKPGYGIISDAIANDAALLYTSRGRFVEYDVLVGEMPRYARARFIDRADLLAGRWAPALEALLGQAPAPVRPALNGADVAAEEILRRV